MKQPDKAQVLRLDEYLIAGSIIGDSFADDPVNRWIFGSAAVLPRFYSLVARKLYLAKGFGHRLGDDGCALWLPPGIKKTIPLWNSIDIAAAMIGNDGFGSVFRGLGVDSTLEARHPTEPHYYLFAIGARPGKQGKGIGGRLMTAGLERVDADGQAAYLESSKERNVPFYRRFGFEVLERIVPAQGCPPLWLMWREPRKSF